MQAIRNAQNAYFVVVMYIGLTVALTATNLSILSILAIHVHSLVLHWTTGRRRAFQMLAV